MDKISILYIEDDEKQRRSLSRKLRSRGFKVTAAKTGQSGLDQFYARTFDTILCDLHMTPYTGLDILDRVREKEPELPFFIITAHGEIPLAVKAIKKGANHFVLKPPEINDLDITIRQTLEQTLVQNRLKESEETLRLVYENIPDIIYSLNPKGEFISVSPSAQTVLGYKPSQHIGTSVIGLIHPEDRARVVEQLERSIRTGKPKIRINTFRMISKKGETKHFEVSRKLVYENGRVIRIDGIARDVTERMALEQRLKDYSASLESKNAEMERVLHDLSRKSGELQAIIDSSMDVIFMVDNVGTVQAINSRVTALFGLSPDEVINKSFDEFTRRIKGSFDDFENFRNKIEELKRTPDCKALCADHVNLTLFLERSYQVSSHSPAILSPFSMCVHDEEGREAGRVWIYVDISLMKRANEQLHTLVTASPTPTIISRVEDGRILYVNKNLADIVGQTPSEMVGQMTPDFYYDPEDREAILAQLKRDGHVFNYEARIKRKDSSLIWMFLSIVPTELGGEHVLLGHLHDISERKEAEERMKKLLRDLERANKNLTEAQSQLIQSEKMASLGTLVAGIAHEINTPIGAVHSMHDTLFRTLKKLEGTLEKHFTQKHGESSPFRNILDVINDANRVITPGTERVINIVKRLRSFARLDEADLKTVDLHEGIEDTLTLIHHELKRDITVTKEYGDIPPITCYPGQLNQVFLNILINARQAIKDKGTITIRTFLEKNMVHISFSDDGVGIAGDKLKKVFDPGFTTKGVGVGTGLGLSISYKIIQDHRGEIKVESKAGKGTTFTVVLPTNLDELLN